MACFAASSTLSLPVTLAWPATQTKMTIIEAAAQASRRRLMRGMRGYGVVGCEIALNEARKSETLTNCLVDERGGEVSM